MRPLRLTVRGLRSYRGECLIDFRDRSLIAIVGDTGAGKSSILEAITYALYNGTTWSQSAASQLLSDGAETMSVELEFQAGDQVWSVHRAMHRAPSRPSTHRLRCLSDPGAGEFDGDAAVSRQVERLLGMSYRAYHAAVVLPQGRFQTLLQETPAKRAAILEGIFRLTDLRAVQSAARELGQRAGAAVGQLRARRESLLPDPAATAEALAGDLETLRRRESVLRDLHALAARTREAALARARRADALREHARLVARPDGGVAGRLASLVPLARAIRDELDEVGAGEAEAARREALAAAAAAEAARVGEDVESLAAAVQLLRGCRQTLADVEAAERAAARDQADLDAGEAALATAAAALPDLEAAARAAGEAAAAAAGALERLRELRGHAAGALRLTRDAAGAHAGAAAEELRRREALPELERRAAARRREAAEAEAAVEAARRALEEAQRRDAAAHAAEGLGSGDECPVCGRPLAADFQPPSGAPLQPLRQALREAEADLQRRRAAETTAAHEVGEGGRRLADAVGQREAAGRAARESAEAAGLVLPGLDLDLGDAELLRPLDERGRQVAAAAAERAEAAEQARGRLSAARADLEARRGEHGRRAARLAQERDRLSARRALCLRDLGRLPPVLAATEGAAPADLDDLVVLGQRLLDAAKRERAALDAVRAEAARLAAARAELQRRLRDEVDEPRALAMRSASELLLRVGDGLRALGRPAPEPAPAAAGIDVEARWAAELDARAAGLREQLEAEIAAGERATAEAAAELAGLLGELDLADETSLDGELGRVGQQVVRVQVDLDAARAQVAVAAGLDGRIATGVEVRDSLTELVRLLQDSQFVGHVIDRRQRQLLAVASQVLGSMTGGAYGFAPDFEIVDRLTGQPRPTRTLSGGETFLASLALALALVEIAARSGTRLDALFLDEGFGSLDAGALDEALSALELQAREGRLVAVVSHVRAVAERIETVLEVTRSPSGSQAEWRGASERELMLAEELEARLLA